MDPALHELLRGAEADGDREIEALIRLRRAGEHVPGVRLVAQFGPIATCRIRAADVASVRRHTAVRSLKAPRSYRPEPEAPSGSEAAPPPAGSRFPGMAGLPGLAGRPGSHPVVVGILDWGLDFAHPEFRRADGRTRVLALWDQRDHPGQAPAPYGYGRLLRRPAIDAALRTATPFATLGYHPADADKGNGAHGTHVASIAAGTSMPGAASDADIVFVELADRATAGTNQSSMGDSVRLLEGIDLVRRTAGERPWVVNLSMGRQGGAKDGRSLVEQALGHLLRTSRGCCVVQSAGNYYLQRAHSQGRVRPGRISTVTFETPVGDATPNEVEVWYGCSDRFEVRLVPPGDSAGPWVRPGALGRVRAGPQEVGRIYHRIGDPNNGDNQIDAFLDRDAPAGRWRLELRGLRVDDGRFHAWIERDQPGQSRFRPSDADPRSTIGTIATGRLPLYVGAYDANAPGMPIWAKSSAGPTRDGRRVPHLCAPGADVRGARSAPPGSHTSPGSTVCMSGTSMAAPAVTAAVARVLQVHPRLDIQGIRRLILDSTAPGPPDPHGRAGRGRLDRARLETALRRSAGAAPDAEDGEPAYLARARQVWRRLHGAGTGVTLRPLSAAPSKLIRTSTFQAWTNSAKDIYVTDVGGVEAWKVVLFHEAVHVRQFTEWGRPVSYEQMVLFEQEAYSATRDWIRQQSLDPDYAKQMDTRARSYEAELTRGRRLPAADREVAFKRFLIAEGLPAHGRLADLYESRAGKNRPAGKTAAEFEGPEHRRIGQASAKAVPATAVMAEGPPLAIGFGDMVALAGDYFVSYDEMVELSRSSGGRSQLAHARWLATGRPFGDRDGPEPTADIAIRRAVADRAARLAATNVNHFSADGANWREYSRWHSAALADAVVSGPGQGDRLWRQARSKEAFALHFLTDAFSAGHVRTPRADIHAWYGKRIPGSGPLLNYLAGFLYDRLKAAGAIPASGLAFPGEARKRIVADIRKQAGAAGETYSFGDIVSLALHDVDGRGLHVISDTDARGVAVPGGHHWWAVGDGRLPARRAGLESPPGGPGAHPGQETWRMVTAAVRASYGELHQVRAAGHRTGAARMTTAQRGDVLRRALVADGKITFAARAYVPRDDPGRNAALDPEKGSVAPLNWRWGQLGQQMRVALDTTMKERLPRELGATVENATDPQVRAALKEFVQHLREDGIRVLERVYQAERRRKATARTAAHLSRI